MKPDNLKVPNEWKVLFSEGEKWRIGVYRPKPTGPAEIKELEQHSCPESFLLIEGEIVMVYRDDGGKLQEKKLDPMQLVTFTEPHAGYSPLGDGVALVVEDAKFETEYTDIKTKEQTRVVKVE